MHALKLDITEQPGKPADLSDLTVNLDVTYERTGVYSGGGNPEVRFTGSWDSLVILAARYLGSDPTDLPMLLKSITLVI